MTVLNHFLLVACLPLFCFTKPYNRIACIKLYTHNKRLTNCYTLFPTHNKQLRRWEVCSLNVPWSFAASQSIMHFINRFTWKSSQYYINHDGVIHSYVLCACVSSK